MIENCPMRHENGNCIPAGGFCTANKNICVALFNAYRMGKAQLFKEGTTSDLISKFIDGLEEIFAHIREKHVDDSVCGLCEYDGAYMGQSGDWCNECPGFDRDDCFKLSDETRNKWTEEIIKALPTAQPEQHEGQWVYGEDFVANCVDGYRCSQCGFFVPWDYNHKLIDYINDYAYCPNCGAKMRGEQHETD